MISEPLKFIALVVGSILFGCGMGKLLLLAIGE